MKIDFKNLFKRHWSILLLSLIFLGSLNVLLFSSHLDGPTAFDPQFQFRYTEYIVKEGVLPSWDYYSYAPVGRPLDTPPLMYYVTAYAFKAFGGMADWDLRKFVVFMPAIFGALSVIPAYMLGRALSGKVAGLLTAIFVGFSPAIVQRSMAGYYDTDGLVVFFSVLTIWTFVYAFKKQLSVSSEIASFRQYTRMFFKEKLWTGYLLVIASMILFALAWAPAWYISIIVLASTGVYWAVISVFGKKEWIRHEDQRKIKPDFFARVKKGFPEFLKLSVPVFISIAFSMIVIDLMGFEPVRNVLLLFRFAQDPTSVLIVNQSVAELQKINIFGGGLAELYSRVSVPVIFAFGGAFILFKRNKLLGSVLLTWALVSLVSISQGVRFMLVFAPAAGVAAAIAMAETYETLKHSGSYSILIGIGMVAATLLSLFNPLAAALLATLILGFVFFAKKTSETSEIAKPLMMGAMILSFFLVLSHGTQTASAFQSDQAIEPAWGEAFQFLRENTAEDAIVGTWWDPGHDITSLGERRNIADGAHCGSHKCTPGMNERITDLGFIFNTDNETLAKERLLKYKDNLSEVYWLSSDDLIHKFVWLQFFGTGCMAGRDPGCPLYGSPQRVSFAHDGSYNVISYHFTDGIQTIKQEDIWIAAVESNETLVPFGRQITYRDGEVIVAETGSSLRTMVWVSPGGDSLVLIPAHLERSMFTRMFFLEEGNFENFELVFRNDKIKIYKLLA